MPVTDLHPSYDPDQERRDVERQARSDAATDWSAVPEADRPPQVALRAIEQRIEVLTAGIDREYRACEQQLAQRIADAEAHAEHAERLATAARAREVAHTRRRDELADVLTGRGLGDDEGRWADRSRMSERVWQATLISTLLYLGAAVVDVGLNYLAFRLMGVSPVETVVLAAGVVLVTILLPKQLGEMIAVHRRRGRYTPRQRMSMVAAATLWLGVSLFVAVVRTRYLLVSGTVGSGGTRRSLLERAGVPSEVLTFGWLAVALAVGTVVAVHAMHRYNPYLRPWRAAGTAAERAGAEHAALRRDADQAHRDLEWVTKSTETLRHNRDTAVEACRAFGRELVETYRAVSARHRGGPGRRTPELPWIDGGPS